MNRRTLFALIAWAVLLVTVPATAYGAGAHRLVSTTEASVMEQVAAATIDGDDPPDLELGQPPADAAELDTTDAAASPLELPPSTTAAPTTTAPLTSSSTGSLPPQLDTTTTEPEVVEPEPIPEPETTTTTVREPPPDTDGEFVDDINAGRPAELVWSDELAAYAEVVLARIMATGLAHSDLAATGPAGWSWLGENLGRGPSQDAIQNAYRASPTHAENQDFAAFTHIGSASATDAVGMIWTVQIFGAR